MAAPTTSSPYVCHFGVGFRKSHIRIAWDFLIFQWTHPNVQFYGGVLCKVSWYVTDRDR